MFDLRYHVASLAAVFFALVIGILVGVALASHGLGNSERDQLQRRLDKTEAQADQLRGDLQAKTDEGRANSEFVGQAYRAVLADRLHRQRVAVLFVGPVDGKLLKSIKQTLADAGAPPPLRLRSIIVPVDDARIDRVLEARPLLTVYAGAEHLDDLGRELADEFVVGGETPLWSSLEQQLVEEQSGNVQRAADAVVVVRSAGPQMDGTARFLHGLLSELAERPIPVVGIEATTATESAVPTFRRLSLTSVDNVDSAVGRVALALLLSGAAEGTYGTKKTASDGILPEVTPVQPVTTTTGG